jgi:hypothetical protein
MCITSKTTLLVENGDAQLQQQKLVQENWQV